MVAFTLCTMIFEPSLRETSIKNDPGYRTALPNKPLQNALNWLLNSFLPWGFSGAAGLNELCSIIIIIHYSRVKLVVKRTSDCFISCTTDYSSSIGGLRSCRVLERIGARALVAHVRTFADFLVYEFSTSAGGQQLNKCIEILNDMVWKYNIVTLDRLILCLVRNLLFFFLHVISAVVLVDVFIWSTSWSTCSTSLWSDQ